MTLSTKLRMSKDADYSSESEDTIASFTSRGIHGSYDGTAKPDVSAPGVGIVSASAGTGNSDEIMSGTSMATPLNLPASPRWSVRPGPNTWPTWSRPS